MMGCGYKCSKGNYEPPNPNPRNFSILEKIQYSKACVLMVHYPGCTTFEGRKILVFEGKFTPYKVLDPHFNSTSNLLARFKPTKEGWQMAKDFAERRKCIQYMED